METVFADQATISAPSEPAFLKPKRSAFIFITADSELSNIALEDLRKIGGVEEVYRSRGAYDIVAKVNGDSLEYIREYVLKQIRDISSIKSTLTLTVV
ncbi:MAG: Lrp/AsnC family transcriptional regulator [Candidatus Bathyarchaeota archaeon]|nr:Lrp/AsnC family transcriptional regulator [Candidatus Bathyarchaeota archaeon]